MTTPTTEGGLSLGSNLGDRLGLLQEARRRVSALKGVEVIACASVYETDPVGVRDRYRDLAYLNTVLIIGCQQKAERLSDGIHDIEAEMGRVRGDDRYAPRTIDIDVLYVGEEHHEEPDLTVPHASWTERRFVVEPLAEVRPELVVPGETRTCREILSALPDTPRAILFQQQW